MKPTQLPDPGVFDQLLTAVDHHPYAVQSLFMFGVLVLIGMYLRRK